MKQVKLLLLIIVCTNIFASCKKTNTTTDEPQLPPETHTGAYTFGCKVDGKIFTASGKGGLLSDQSVWGGGVYSDSSVLIGASNSKQKFSFDLSVKYNGSLGLLYTSTYPYNGSFQDNSNGTIPGNFNTYSTDSFQIGKVNLKYLIQANIVSGTFEMDAKNGNGKVIHITEGRFDIGK